MVNKCDIAHDLHRRFPLMGNIRRECMCMVVGLCDYQYHGSAVSACGHILSTGKILCLVSIDIMFVPA